MDLLDFSGEHLYFDGSQSPEITRLIDTAADAYGRRDAEPYLMRAYFLEPEDLNVLVALYRYYYYQHRYEDALIVAHRAMDAAGAKLGIGSEWSKLTEVDLAYGVQHSMTLMRFYLYALKGAGYLKLRLGDTEGALCRLNKVAELDKADRIGARALLDVVASAGEMTDEFDVANG